MSLLHLRESYEMERRGLLLLGSNVDATEFPLIEERYEFVADILDGIDGLPKRPKFRAERRRPIPRLLARGRVNGRQASGADAARGEGGQ